jgi:organic hydroperoxide reductase OsmC/OhrA
VADQKLIPLPENLSVDTCVNLGSTTDGLGLALDIVIDLPGIDSAVKADLITEAKKICPYCNAVKDNVPINISAT